jgi:hypothetical protein
MPSSRLPRPEVPGIVPRRAPGKLNCRRRPAATLSELLALRPTCKPVTIEHVQPTAPRSLRPRRGPGRGRWLQIPNHESPRTTKLYARTGAAVSLDEIERILRSFDVWRNSTASTCLNRLVCGEGGLP